jgi:hypothetical protein
MWDITPCVGVYNVRTERFFSALPGALPERNSGSTHLRARNQRVAAKTSGQWGPTTWIDERLPVEGDSSAGDALRRQRSVARTIDGPAATRGHRLRVAHQSLRGVDPEPEPQREDTGNDRE